MNWLNWVTIVILLITIGMHVATARRIKRLEEDAPSRRQGSR